MNGTINNLAWNVVDSLQMNSEVFQVTYCYLVAFYFIVLAIPHSSKSKNSRLHGVSHVHEFNIFHPVILKQEILDENNKYNGVVNNTDTTA